MIVDCDDCAMRHTSACDECIVTVLFDGPFHSGVESTSARRVELDEDEMQALGHLAEGGLVAPLRLVPRTYDDDAAAG